jgi:hypothetical protein
MPRKIANTLHALLGALAIAAGASRAEAQETFTRAAIDQRGQLRITSSLGHRIAPAKEKEQVGFANVSISADRRAVGWLALFPNCCTTYPVPLRLVLYSMGHQRKFSGNGLAFARWTFSADGKRVAFRQETVHSSQGVHYELHDISNGRLVAAYDPDSANLATPPRWVQALDAAP